MYKIRYLQKSGAIVLVLVGAKSASEAIELVKASDTEYKQIVQCRWNSGEVWYIRTEPAN